MQKLPRVWILGLILISSGPLQAQPAPASSETLVKPVLATIKSGDQTSDEAWQKGQLTTELVVAALGSRELVAGELWIPSGEVKLAHALAKTLLQNQPEVLNKASELSPRALLQLGNYLSSDKDGRAVALYEEVLRRQPKRSPEWNGEADTALYRLSEYYSSMGQIQKAIDTKSRIYEYTTSPASLANYEVQIARLHAQKGDEAQAAQWYEAAEDRGDPRAIGVSRMDRVRALFANGKKDEARALLRRPLGKLSEEESQKHPFQVALLTQLAQSYFEDGDLETAAQLAARAVTLFKGQTESPDVYVTGYGPVAQRLVTQIETRQKSPFYWEEDSAPLFITPGGKPQSQRLVLRFKTAPKGEIEFKCDDPSVIIEPVVGAPTGKDALTRIVYLSLAPKTLQPNEVKPNVDRPNPETFLIATSAEFPGHEARARIFKREVLGNRMLPRPATATKTQ